MRRFLGWTAAAVLAVGMVGCTNAGKSGEPCESCTYAYVPVKKTSERQTFCEVNGKRVDCKKNPPECPECAKNAGK